MDTAYRKVILCIPFYHIEQFSTGTMGAQWAEHMIGLALFKIGTTTQNCYLVKEL